MPLRVTAGIVNPHEPAVRQRCEEEGDEGDALRDPEFVPDAQVHEAAEEQGSAHGQVVCVLHARERRVPVVTRHVFSFHTNNSGQIAFEKIEIF